MSILNIFLLSHSVLICEIREDLMEAKVLKTNSDKVADLFKTERNGFV